MSFLDNPDHPVWPLMEKLAGYALVIGVLSILTSVNSTHFDWALKGEAGTIGGTGLAGLAWVFYQWWSRDLGAKAKEKQHEDDLRVLVDEYIQKQREFHNEHGGEGRLQQNEGRFVS